ncbi:MAG: hypothetical protein RLZZ351_363 [Pseudomonadota bacterium]
MHIAAQNGNDLGFESGEHPVGGGKGHGAAGIDKATINTWLSQKPWDKLVNRAGMTWRNLSDAEKAAVTDEKSASHLMLEKTSVIKRPILVKNDTIIALGFDEATYQTIIN